jgi:hypothetical protein
VDKVQKHIDLGYLDSRTKSNPKLMMEIAAYLQQTPLVAAMGESMENKDWPLLRASVHNDTFLLHNGYKQRI